MKIQILICVALATLAARDAVAHSEEEPLLAWFLADRLEYREATSTSAWDLMGWVGRDYRKLWFKAEGDREGGRVGESELQLLYGHAVSPYFDLQVGVRHDIEPSPSRNHLVLGFQGLAPYWFEIDAAVFVSEDGDVSARFEAEYELLLTQRLILQPRVEVNVAAQDVEELGIGSGINDTSAGLRLRYELHRKFAPYIGVSWARLYGDTADIAEAAGDDADDLSFVAGLRFWF